MNMAKKQVVSESVDYSRQTSVVDLEKYSKIRIDVVGAGATGSKIVLDLAKHGFRNIHVYDFDKVELHNVPNQVYGPKDVGLSKVEALQEIVLRLCGIKITAHLEKYTGNEEEYGEVVFLAVDTMSERKNIFTNINQKIGLELIIETRTGVYEGRVYSITPNTSRKKYLESMYSDDVAVQTACGGQIMIGATSSVVAGMSVWCFLEWLQGTTKPPSELIFSLVGERIMSQSSWSEDIVYSQTNGDTNG